MSYATDFCCTSLFVQNNAYEKLDFRRGKWNGTGSGFGNNQSIVQPEFKPVMDGQYIEVKNDAKFEPTEKNPDGEHHVDWGMISFDKNREKIVYREFNIE